MYETVTPPRIMTTIPESSYTLETLLSSDDLTTRLEGIVDEIRDCMPTDGLIVIALLKGSFVFLADLIRLLHRHGIAMEVDFMAISSYGDAMTGGDIRVKKDIETDITGRPVLLVDDILDTGRTLTYACDLLGERGPSCLKICALLDKPSRRIKEISADIVGFTIPDHFVVGYGLDYARRHRELPYIARVVPVE